MLEDREDDDAVARFVRGRSEGKGRSDGDHGTARVSAMWDALDDISNDPAVLEMRAQARSRAAALSIRTRRLRWAGGLALAASLVVAIGVTGFGLQPVVRTQTAPTHRYTMFANGIGAPRAFALSDGSRVTLDARSELRLVDWDKGRTIVLDRGRAFFDVAHDPRHPFRVSASGSQVTAIGTSFEVAMIPTGMAVTLTEGRVKVEMPGVTMGARSTELARGTKLLFAGGHWNVRSIRAVDQPVWRTGVLVFDNTPLAYALEQINPYLERPLAPAGNRAAATRISGVFRLSDRAKFAQVLWEMGARTEEMRRD